jgi:16S rRNA (guanine1516-N2)-methyltransferase
MNWQLKVDMGPNSAYHRYSPDEQRLINQRIEYQDHTSTQVDSGLVLSVTDAGVSVSLPTLKKPYSLSLDEGQLGRRVAQGSETLCRVTGASRGQIISIYDATAGLCREAHLMASCGALVSASERSLPLYLIAKEALCRANSSVKLSYQDSSQITVNPHVIYLDPMFPKSLKKAAVGKEAVLLRALAHRSDLATENHLLEWALDSARCRVVVKRPIKAVHFGDREPTASVRGKAIRFDIYGKTRLPKSDQKQ